MSPSTNVGVRRDWRDIKRGARLNFLGILARSPRALYLILVARLFGSEMLGLYLLGWAVVDVCSKFGIFGLDRGLLRFLPSRADAARRPERARLVRTALLMGLVTSSMTAAGLYLLAPIFGEILLNQPAVVSGLRILSLAVVPLTLSSILLALTRSERQMQYEVWVRSLIEPGLLIGLAVLFWLAGWDWGLFAAQTLALTAGAVVSAVFCFRLGLLDVRADQPAEGWVSRLGSFALPVAGYDFLAIGVMSLDLFLLARWVPPAELGIYGAAVQVAILTKKARQSFEPILLPVLSERVQQRDREAVKASLQSVSRSIAVFALGFLLLVVVFGREILRLYGEEFAAGATALVLIAAGHAMHGFWGVAENVILLKKPEWNLLNWIVGALVALAANLLLIPRFGLEGAAASVVIVFLVICSLTAWQAYGLSGWIPVDRELTTLVALVLGLGFLTYTLKLHGPDTPLFRVPLAVGMLGAYAYVLVGLSRAGGRT